MFENYPISELQKRLGIPKPLEQITKREDVICSEILRPYQKYYQHDSCCSGDRRKPIGHPGCACLRWLREGYK